jgi:hypothetical protein
VSVAEYPTANISKSLVKGHQLCRRALFSWGHGGVLFFLFGHIVSAICNHVISKFLPQDDPFSLSVLEDVLAGVHFPSCPVVVDRDSELIRRDHDLRKASLAIVFEEFDRFSHWYWLVPIWVRSVLPFEDMLLGVTNENASRGQQSGFTAFGGGDITQDASYATVVQDITKAKFVCVVNPLDYDVRMRRRRRFRGDDGHGAGIEGSLDFDLKLA